MSDTKKELVRELYALRSSKMDLIKKLCAAEDEIKLIKFREQEMRKNFEEMKATYQLELYEKLKMQAAHGALLQALEVTSGRTGVIPVSIVGRTETVSPKEGGQ